MPEKLCKICGKIPTNHPSGTCVMCMLNGVLPSQASRREMQGKKDSRFKIQDLNMTANNKEEVMPKGNVPIERQCKVEGCFKFAVKDGMCIRDYNEAHGIKTRVGRKPKRENDKKPAESEIKKKHRYPCEAEGCKKGQWKDKRCMVHWKEKHGTPFKKKSQASLQSPQKVIECKSASRGKVAEPESILIVDTHVSIDLSNFPKIYKFITALPEISAFDMLGVLLKGRLNELEERIKI